MLSRGHSLRNGLLTPTLRKSLDESEASQVLSQILSWIVVCVQRGSTQMVVRKLCSTLVVYFLQFSAFWSLPVKHLVLCLCADQFVATTDVQDAPEVLQLISQLSPQKLSATLWFTTILAEEVSKTDGNNIKQ